MKQWIQIARMVSLGITLLTSLPLFIRYLSASQARQPLVVHLHVWFGLLFLVLVVAGMITNRKTIQRP
jgi:hypothetical protein